MLVSLIAGGVFCASAQQSYTATIVAGGLMPATATRSGSAVVIPAVSGLAADSTGNVYFSSNAQYLSGSNAVFMLTPNGALTRIAGNGIAGFSGDGGPATAAQLNGPSSLAADNSGNLYILDVNNLRVRKVSPNGLSVAAKRGTSSAVEREPRVGLRSGLR
jgi:hypothetical protein